MAVGLINPFAPTIFLTLLVSIKSSFQGKCRSDKPNVIAYISRVVLFNSLSYPDSCCKGEMII